MVTAKGLCGYLHVMLWEIVHLVNTHYFSYVYSSQIFIIRYCTNIRTPCQFLVFFDNI